MKKTILIALMALLGIGSMYAQCTPDPNINDLIVPPAGSYFDTVNGDPIVILPYGHVGMAYSEVLYFKIPADTTISTMTAIINYVKLDSIMGLHSAMTLGCSPSNCQFPGGSAGCASMSGTPVVADSVELRIAIEYNISIGGLPTPIKDTLGGFYFVTKGQAIGIEENIVGNFTPTLFPNPASSQINIEYHSAGNSTANVQISNVIGRIVRNENFKLQQGDNRLNMNISKLKSGIYLYTVHSQDRTFTGRFTISR